MSKSSGPVHVATIRRQHKGREYVTHLLRRSYREAGKVKNETVANISCLPAETVELLRRSLRGECLVGADELFKIERSRPHGHVAAVAAMARKVGLADLLGPACRQRDIAFALIVARACRPGSKLATVRWWADTTLTPDLGILTCDTDDVYAAMDWLVGRQEAIEKELAGRHLVEGGLVLYDLSGSWVEGRCCPLAAYGYSRDRKRGKRQIVYGLVTDAEGRPVAINVFPGNTADPTAFVATVKCVRERFGLSRVVLVGDRGMITDARIADLKAGGGLGWITALRAPQIKALAASGALQLGLFDEVNLAEIADAELFPGERLVVCRNPAVAAERARKRSELLAATEVELDKIVAAVGARRLKDAGKIGVKAGAKLNKHKMGKHFQLDISEGRFSYRRKQDAIDAEAALDGLYVIRTGVPAADLEPAGVVEAYKLLAHVEQAFSSLKTIDLEIRPIRHWLEDRVRAHVFICMLAEYLVWHLRRAWAPLCFTDEQPPERDDPVASAQRSIHAYHKASRQTLPDGQPVHSLPTLLDHLAALTRDDIIFNDGSGARIQKLAEPTPTQRRAFELLETPIPMRIKP